MNPDLLALLDSAEFEVEGTLELVTLERAGQRGRLVLAVNFETDVAQSQHWEFVADRVLAHRVLADEAESLELLQDHVLLNRFRASQATLSFAGTPQDARDVVADLWAAHVTATDGWIDFQEFLNGHLPLAELVGSGSGVLAKGPTPLLAAYGRALQAHGMHPGLLLEWPAPVPSAQVLIWDRSYVVGTGFACKRVK
jgi:hypothetical protein